MSDIRDTLVKVTKNVTKTSGDLLKSAKLSVSLSNEETALKNVYIEIGKKVHEIYTYGGSLGSFFDEKYKEVEQCTIKINNLKEQMQLIKGVRECPKCGKTTAREAGFCPKCGASMEGALTVETTPEPAAVAPVVPEMPPMATVQAKRRCNACGAESDADTKFCLSCGRIL